MINFKQFLEQHQIEETVAVFPGGFKPPTKGHFLAFQELLQNASRGVVFIGTNIRDGIDQDMSYQIWSIYAPYLPKPVRIEKSMGSPVKSTYDLAKEFPYTKIIVGAGSKEKDTRFNSFEKNPDTYPNVSISRIDMQSGGINGTDVRVKLINKDPDAVNYFVPQQIKETDKERIKSILGIA
jgi:hypothetical protein